MIVYVESNFVIALARRQEESQIAERLLQMAEAGTITLVFPSLAVLVEPFSTLTYKRVERNRFAELLRLQASDIGRSMQGQSLAGLFVSQISDLVLIAEDEMARPELTVKRMLQCGAVAEITAAIFAEAQQYKVKYGLSPQDSIILATIIADFRARPTETPKCFLSHNSRDFEDRDIVGDLKSYNCRYIAKFEHGLEFIEHSR